MTRIAAIQMTSNHLVSENLQQAEHWLAAAQNKGAEAVVLPENFAFMGLQEFDKRQIAEHYGTGPIQDFLGHLANKYKIWLFAGTMPLLCENDEKGRVTASTLVYNPDGKCVARYDKIHLFDVAVDHQEAHVESKTIVPGRKLVTVPCPFATVGLTICYDLRFPELYRKLFNSGAEVFVVPSAFTQKTGITHWEVLLRARAIENFCYVIAPNQTGTHSNGRMTFGHSMIIDPWGKVLDCLESGEGFVMAEIDLAYLKDIRQRFPVFEHQRVGKEL